MAPSIISPPSTVMALVPSSCVFSMILRLKSPEGITRIEIDQTASAAALYQQVGKQLNLDAEQQFWLSADPTGSRPLPRDSHVSLRSLGLTSGEFIYIAGLEPKVHSTNTFSKGDDIDRIVERKEGLIPRIESKKYCKHSEKGTCENCLPLEPYDPGYAAEHKIKHLSYHSYLRKLGLEKTPGSSSRHSTKGTFVHSLEEPDYRPKKCLNHPPNGMCTKCQISAIVLLSQSFRMVDHVEFQSSTVIDSFIEYWRKTGYQRFGILYGYYAEYDKVPLGIKAVVCAIYEPQQDCSVDGFELLTDGQEEQEWSNALQDLSQAMHLTPVGMIFTDLQDDSSGTGKVLSKRSKETFFISGFEAVFSAQMQAKHRSRCKYSSSGYFGSKFVSVVISADESGSIGLFPYQVSNSCVAMVQASFILPTTEPSMLKVVQKEDHVLPDSAYIPEVFYKYKNEYGVEVQQAAKPTFPVDYLIVSLTHGFPSNPDPLFVAQHPASFPGPHRRELNQRPTIQALNSHLFGREYSLQLFCDFNLLLFLAKCGFLQHNDLKLLYRAVEEKDNALFEEFLASPSWLSLALVLEDTTDQQFMDADMEESFSGQPQTTSTTGNGWVCSHCTFINAANANDCEMCALPR